ncbi:putative SAM-dependent methyltransferase [Rubrobacter radiotolerans]|uniref:Class I SAM-dependent rRNA methyltransferase n=1 Tax=Rubrobacter radiotolerans TaxID=42256 RepID=A0A023X1E7_RUBRA|nr:class I SAM-dependent rRNA methyltransferase [Rubrobacter radiotolerans]AHY46016.1 putative SAM-dependent methyltransferase [Rubrobacter radiotolerans]MDX5893428.1 class I SAM-dependent rRNA methyltransferase [Rubrobacter radiotolerans]SMC03715.1 23S rRNA (cytosine1962-C5)-methyltransferase [Rubrobacter radiotolerans DSM 5868]
MERGGFVVVNGKGARRLRAGHPWVYGSDVVEERGEAGDAVTVRDGRGTTLGTAFYNPQSTIRIRLVSREPVEVDDGWFRERIDRAVAYRETLGIDGDSLRLVHAEADGLPGLVVDRYGDVLVAQVGTAAVERHLEAVVEALVEGIAPAGVLLRGDTAARGREGLAREDRTLYGEVPQSVVVREGSVRFRVDLRGGQKTGSFLDQRENHLLAGRLARGRTLDVFSYAGGFGLHAAWRSESVEFVDASGPALDTARQNAALNGLENVTFTRANAFNLLRERSDAGESYDTVILDPPAFAKTRREVGKALRAYKEINLRAMKLLAPGGHLITCSCSFHLSREEFEETLRRSAADAGAVMRVLEWRGQGKDHPELLTVPETRYLKCAVLQKT